MHAAKPRSGRAGETAHQHLKGVGILFALVTVTIPAIALATQEQSKQARVAKELDLGEPAPQWLIESEAYAIGYNPQDWDALAQSKVAFITHCPVNREFFERCHALGIRCFPYVTFYQGYASMSYEDVNLKDHPEFIEVDAAGNLKRTGFWESEDAKNMYTTCPNVATYQDAMVAWVEKLMKLGADGVFVDNLSNRAACFGPKFGKHQHITEDQNHAFALLLGRVRDMVKRYKPDGAVLGNSANPIALPREYWKHLDAEMLESYICTWVSKDRWFDWEGHWNKAGKDLQPFVRAGKQIQALSYLGHTPYGVREDAFFCYASARLAGFVWNGGTPISNPDTALLYRIRLGKALGEEREQDGVHFRVFERGLVAVNPNKERAGRLAIAAPIPTRRLVDLFGGGARGWNPFPEKGFQFDAQTRHSGSRSITATNKEPSDAGGAAQSIVLNQTRPLPITMAGWSKAENVSGTSDGNYAIYIDALYSDGTPLYGQVAPFSTGSHDWEFRTATFTPEKPVRSLTLNCLFRNKTGTVWFDDISLREEAATDQPADAAEVVQNGGFEQLDTQSRILDLTEPGSLEIPAYSGRVYLYASDTADELASRGPVLTVVTSPAMGDVRFRVDGFDYWTHSGHWTTEYTLGPNFGKFTIRFDKPGKHTVEIVDVVPAAMKTPKGYGTGERLGQFMDPSNPTKPMGSKKFTFRSWQDRGAAPQVSLEVAQDISLVATFDVEQTEEGSGKPKR